MPFIPHMIKEMSNFKMFIKLFILKGGDRLVGHTKGQHFQFCIGDDGLSAMQFNILCTSPNWGLEEWILVWRQDEDDKCMLHDGKSKPCNAGPVRNGPEAIKSISRFIYY